MSSEYVVGQEVPIVEHYLMARSSGHIRGPAKHSTATVVEVDADFALLDTGERIEIATGKLLTGEKA